MKILNVLILLTLFSVLGISDSHAEECVKKFDTKWGDSCNSKDSFSVRLINTCMHNVDVRVCLKRKNGRWKCFVESNVRPNEIIGKYWGYYVCRGTGDVKWFWRKHGENVPLGKPE